MKEQDNRENSTTTESLTDLPVSLEQAEETKAGSTSAGNVSVHDISITKFVEK